MRCKTKNHAASLRYSKMNMYHGVSWNGMLIYNKKKKPLEMRFNLTESINSVLPY
jgi:hypothetical protein